MSKICVLIIDTHPMFKTLLNRFLTESYHAALTVVNVEPEPCVVLDCVRAYQPQIILVGLNGNAQTALRLVPLIREASPKLHIMVLSLFDDAVYEQAALQAGADRFLGKEYVSTTLIPEILRISKTAQAADEGETT